MRRGRFGWPRRKAAHDFEQVVVEAAKTATLAINATRAVSGALRQGHVGRQVTLKLATNQTSVEAVLGASHARTLR